MRIVSKPAMTALAFPTSVRIAYRDYTIIEWTELDSNNTNRFGQCKHNARQISVTLAYGTREGASTLLHEILHAAWLLWSMANIPKEEEPFVEIFGDALSTVWRDNPDVFAWIHHHLVHGT